jgi:hypothetical protein
MSTEVLAFPRALSYKIQNQTTGGNHMSKGKKKQTEDYPFSPEHWGRWNNSKRLKWMRNFRDRLRENDDAMAKKFDLGIDQLRQLDADVRTLEKLVLAETAKNN